MKTKTQKTASGNDHHCGTNQDGTEKGGTLPSGSGAKMGRKRPILAGMGAIPEQSQGGHLGTAESDPSDNLPVEILTETFAGEVIPFTAAGAFVNATAMCGAFGKRPNHFLSLESTKDFIAELEKLNAENPESDARNPGITSVITRKGNFGGNENQGTWLHPDLALECARWLSPRFAIWTNRIIRRILAGEGMPAAPALAFHCDLESLIVAHYQGKRVAIQAGNGFVNVTNVIFSTGKKPLQWERTEKAKELIASLARETGIPAGELIETKRGPLTGGTWFHPVLALDVARWFSADFSFWLEKVIRRVAAGNPGAALAGRASK